MRYIVYYNYMRLCKTHTGTKIHKLARDQPCCVNRKKGLSTDYVVIYEFEGDESLIDCKKCLSKIRKFSKQTKGNLHEKII